MNTREKSLSAIAAALLATSVFSALSSPFLCLASAVGALALSLYLRHRGAFLNDNTPLLGALLIGGSAMCVFGGFIVVSPKVGLFVVGLILVPIFLFLLAFGARERMRAIIRRIDAWMPDDKPRD
jgi:hypothetical protein